MWRTTMHAAALAAALATAGSAAAKAPPRVTVETSETYGCTTKRNRGTAPSGTPGNPNRSDISGTGR